MSPVVPYGTAHVQPDAPWRLLIKGMAGNSGVNGAFRIQCSTNVTPPTGWSVVSDVQGVGMDDQNPYLAIMYGTTQSVSYSAGQWSQTGGGELSNLQDEWVASGVTNKIDLTTGLTPFLNVTATGPGVILAAIRITNFDSGAQVLTKPTGSTILYENGSPTISREYGHVQFVYLPVAAAGTHTLTWTMSNQYNWQKVMCGFFIPTAGTVGLVQLATGATNFIGTITDSFPNPLGSAVATNEGPYYVTFNASTRIYSRTTAGIINFDLNYGALTERRMSSGTYRVNPIVVTKDPVHGTGGSFWRMVEGPNVGWLVSKWTNTLGYGDITITQPAEGVSFKRGPGATLLTLTASQLAGPAAHLCGANMRYNGPGEFHFTMLVDDPNLALIQPKQCHYAIEFQDLHTGLWHEGFAGLIWDMSATDTEVVFTGLDYLGLLRVCIDERFDPKKPEKPTPTGSKYVSKTISTIIAEHLAYCIAIPDSPVNFITVGSIATMSETTTIYSTMNDALSFIVGLIESHRAGTGKYSRIFVQKQDDGTYQFVVLDDPGTNLDSLPVVYGGLAQGYQVIKFGDGWASRVNLMGRSRDGAAIMYAPDSSGVDQSIYGRIGTGAELVQPSATFMPVAPVKAGAPNPNAPTSNDLNDLKRRAKQAALDASRLGRQIGIGLRLGSFRPFEGYDLLDRLPIQIDHGAVKTADWASDVFGAESPGVDTYVQAGYWTIVGIEWESYDDSHWMTNFILWPTGGGATPREPCSMAAVEWVADGPTTLKATGADSPKTTSVPAPSFSPAVIISALWLRNSFTENNDYFANVMTVGSPWTMIESFSNPLNIDYTTWGWGVACVPWTSGTVPDAVFSWSGVYTRPGEGFLLSIALLTDATAPVQSGWAAHGVANSHISLAAPPTEGNMLVLVAMGGAGPPPGDWTLVRSSTGDLPDNYKRTATAIYVRCVGAGESADIELQNTAPGGPVSMVSEWELAYDNITVPDYVTPRVDIAYGNGAPPAVGSGTEPNATTYVNATTGERYTRNDNTDTWDLIVGSGTPSLLPAGGATGAVLTKDTDTDYDVSWVVPAAASLPTDGMVPYYIAAAETFTVPIYKQAPFAVTIDNEGLLVVDGMLIEVD